MAEAPLSPMVKDAAGNMVPRPKDMFGNPMKVSGDPGWNPLVDQNPIVQGFNALTNAMTPQYDVPEKVGDVAYTPPQRDYLGDVEAANVQQNQARQNQLGIAELIAARARGEGPSIAEMQLRQSTDRLQNQQAGLIASQRGMNPALQRRLIMGQAAQGQQQMNAQAAMLRAQEQQAAQALAAQTYGSMRGQDQSAYGVGAQANQGQSAINADIARANAQAEWNRFEAERQKAVAEANARAGIIQGAASAGITAAGAPGALSGGGGGGGFAGTGVIGGGSIAGNQSSGLNTTEKWYNDPYYYQGTGMGQAGYNTSSGTNTLKKSGFAEGGVVPGYAQGGDSPRNDTVPAWLSPGEAVVPRSIMQAPDAPDRAAAFIAMLKQEAARGSAENPQAFSMGGMAKGYAEGGVVAGGSKPRMTEAEAKKRADAFLAGKAPLDQQTVDTLGYYPMPDRPVRDEMKRQLSGDRLMGGTTNPNSPSTQDMQAYSGEMQGYEANIPLIRKARLEPSPYDWMGKYDRADAESLQSIRRGARNPTDLMTPAGLAEYQRTRATGLSPADVMARRAASNPASGLAFLLRNGSK